MFSTEFEGLLVAVQLYTKTLLRLPVDFLLSYARSPVPHPKENVLKPEIIATGIGSDTFVNNMYKGE